MDGELEWTVAIICVEPMQGLNSSNLSILPSNIYWHTSLRYKLQMSPHEHFLKKMCVVSWEHARRVSNIPWVCWYASKANERALQVPGLLWSWLVMGWKIWLIYLIWLWVIAPLVAKEVLYVLEACLCPVFRRACYELYLPDSIWFC